MKEVCKRFGCILLSCIITVSAFPLAAFAAEDGEEFPENSITQVYINDVLGDAEESFIDGDASPIFNVDTSINAGSDEEVFTDDSITVVNPGEGTLGDGEGEEVFPDDSTSVLIGSDDSLGLEDDEEQAALDSETMPVPVEDAVSAQNDEQTSQNDDGEQSKDLSLNQTEPESDNFHDSEESEDSTHGSEEAVHDNADELQNESSLEQTDSLSTEEQPVGSTYANAYVTVSSSRINVRKGERSSVTVSIKNFTGSGYVQFATTNSSAFRCSWSGKWSGFDTSLNIDGTSTGNGYVYVYLKNSAGTILSTAKLQVVVHNASLQVSASSVSVKKGNTVSVSISYSGYDGCGYLRYGTTNSSAYSCSWGSWSGKSIPLKISGNSVGKGTVTVYFLSVSGETLAYKSFSVSVTSPENPKLSNIPASKSIAVNESVVINPSFSGYSGTVYMQYGITNTSVCSCSWGSWSGSSVPFTITGKAPGKSTITIYLKSVSGITLASCSMTVSVYKKDNPKLTASKTSIDIDTGKSSAITLSVSGVSGSCYLQYSSSNTSAFSCTWGNWSGNSVNLIVTGKNAGSGSINVYLKNLAGNVLASANIFPVKINSVAKPSIKASSASVSLNAGASKNVTITCSNCNVSAYLQYGTTNSSAYSCAWGAWSGNSIPLKITGRNKGNGSVTVYLKQTSNNAVLAQISFSVNVVGGGNGSKSDGKYNFKNYSKPSISLDICEYMFGKNQTARKVYEWDIGNGGVCYGMSTSSGLLNITKDAPTVSSFSGSRSSIWNMSKSDYSSSLGLSLSGFVEAMHIAQVSTYTNKVQCSLETLANVIRNETGKGNPVCVCVRGQQGGHAITAYDYTETGNEMRVKIYDSNYPSNERTLYLRKSGGSYTNWSYDFSDSIHWGTGYPSADIRYVTYDNFYSVWNKRGGLANGSYNLICTDEDDFSIYGFNDDNGKNDILVAQYENGVLTYQSESVIDVSLVNMLPDGSFADSPNILYVPIDYYTVKDDSPDTGIRMSLSNLDLSAEIETDVDEFEICANDGAGSNGLGNVARVMLTPKEGENYKITLGSIRTDEPDEIILEGAGTGKDELIGASFENGELSIVGDDASASLSVGNFDVTYLIDVLESDGGQIWTEFEGEIHDGDTVLYHIKPDDGYQLKDVYVDGKACGSVSEYYFKDICKSHSIAAIFVKDLNSCTIMLSQETYIYDGKPKCPEITVTDQSHNKLVLDADYEISYMNNIDVGKAACIITTLPDSGYGGTVIKEFTITEGSGNAISIRQSENNIYVDAMNLETSIIICAVYDAQWKMVDISSMKVEASTSSIEYQFSELKVDDGNYVKVFLLDQSFTPLCSPGELTLTKST